MRAPAGRRLSTEARKQPTASFRARISRHASHELSRGSQASGAIIFRKHHSDGALRVLALLLAACVSACAYHLNDPIEAHYQRYAARMPEGDRVFACSAYGCRKQTPFQFTGADIAKLQAMMAPAKTKTAADERAALRETLAWMEHRVDDEVGTSNDRPGDDMAGNGDPTQMDCVDVATNLSSYMLVLDRHHLLHYHSVGGVYVKEDYLKGVSGWTHYAGILIEKASGRKFAVDGWLLASGKPPEITAIEKWYIDDSDILFGNGSDAPETTSSIAPANAPKRN
jgi:hypothetical protein